MQCTIHGDDIILRDLTMEDYSALCEVWCDPVAMDLVVGGAMEPSQVEQRLRTVIADAREWPRRRYRFAVVERATGDLIGSVGVEEDRFDSAYISTMVLHRNAQGKGYGTQSMNLIMGHAFNSMGARRAWCGVIPDNKASERMLIGLGMTAEGFIRGGLVLGGRPPADLRCYGMQAEEWRARNAHVSELIQSKSMLSRPSISMAGPGQSFSTTGRETAPGIGSVPAECAVPTPGPGAS